VAGRERDQRVAAVLESVGLPGGSGSRYPREFSGGQRQRIAIARALVTEPRLVVCDEAVSALDLSTQAQVLNLLADLRRGTDLGYLFIAHDMSVVEFLAQRVVVLYRGRVMEQGLTQDVIRHPTSDYTRVLMAASPVPDPDEQARRRATWRALRDQVKAAVV
jgi:peptide/nickel transport system ATP-binding protein